MRLGLRCLDGYGREEAISERRHVRRARPPNAVPVLGSDLATVNPPRLEHVMGSPVPEQQRSGGGDAEVVAGGVRLLNDRYEGRIGAGGRTGRGGAGEGDADDGHRGGSEGGDLVHRYPIGVSGPKTRGARGRIRRPGGRRASRRE